MSSTEPNILQMAQNEKPELTPEAVLESLKDVYDPEIPVNIVDLGLIYNVTIVDSWVGVKMTLTSPGCGLADKIAEDVKNRMLSLPGVQESDVRIVWNPPWDKSMMSPEARQKLIFGV